MHPPDRTLDPARLLAEAGWVRRLAARLVADSSVAEDLAQETLLAALEHPPAASGVLRAWLTRVARNLSGQRRRRERDRSHVERGAARAEALESASEAAERMQLQRALAEAVLDLPEPYRSAVIWRHLDGHSAAEIAARQACTSETARQRVSRGLAMLRARLDRDHGSRATWLAYFVAHGGFAERALVASASTASAVTVGGWIMTGKSIAWIVAAAGLAGLAWLGWHALSGTDSRGIGAESVLAAPADAVRSEPATRAPSGAQSSEPGDAERSVVTEERGRTIRGTVHDRRGAPLAKAELSIERDGLKLEKLGSRHTDAEGRFEWPLTTEEANTLTSGEIEVLASAWFFLPGRAVLTNEDLIAIELSALPIVEVRLRDPDGRRVRGEGQVTAIVEDEHSGGSGEMDLTPSGEDDSWTCACPPGRLLALRARAPGFATTRIDLDVVLEPEGHVEEMIELDAGLIVRGVVLDAESRVPIAQALVLADERRYSIITAGPRTLADSAGRFELHGVDRKRLQAQPDAGGRVQYSLAITAEAEGFAADPRGRIAAWSAPEGPIEGVEVLLAPARGRIEGRVLLTDRSTPARDFVVRGVDARRNVVEARTDEAGEFEISGLPAGHFALVVYPPDPRAPSEQRCSASAEREIAGQTFEIELVLGPALGVVEGRVIDLEGHGVGGLGIWGNSMFETAMGTHLGIGDGWAQTDEQGRFRFEHVYPGAFGCNVARSREGLVCEPDSRQMKLAPGQVVTGQDFTAAPALHIEGRVVRGTACAGVAIWVRDPSLRMVVAQTKTDADGRFAVGGLYPRDYEIHAREGERELGQETVSPAGASAVVIEIAD